MLLYVAAEMKPETKGPCKQELNVTPDSTTRRTWTDCVFLFLLTLVVYGRTLGHDFILNWDDNWYIIYNDAVRGFSWNNLRLAFTEYYIGHYAPLHIVSYMADYTLWGLSPRGFHLTNIILHGMNGILVYRLLLRLHLDRTAALAGAAVFLVHPVQVETVAWISQRKSLLALLLMLLSWEAYCRYRDAALGKRLLPYSSSLALFVLSLLAKSMTVVFPLVLLLFDRCFTAGRPRPAAKSILPFFLAAGGFAALVMYTQIPDVGGGGRAPYHGGSPWATFLTMLPVFCRYLIMLIWPAGLSAEYAPTVHQSIDLTAVGAAVLLSLVMLGGLKLYRADRRLGFWFLFFWIGLLPVSQIVPMIFLMYDHYLYMPLIGVGALAGLGISRLGDIIPHRRRFAVCAMAVIALLALSGASIQRAAAWRNGVTLWSDAVLKEPDSDHAWEHLGEALHKLANDPEGALKAYERGHAINPDNTEILQGLGDVHTERGDLDRGLEYLKRLIALKPYYVTGWASLGYNQELRGAYGEAEKAYLQALRLQPEAMQVVTLLANLAIKQKQPEKARSYLIHLENAGWLEPAMAFRMACLDAQSGNSQSAMAWLEKALGLGFNDYRAIETSPELSAIRNDPRFDALLRSHALPQSPDR